MNRLVLPRGEVLGRAGAGLTAAQPAWATSGAGGVAAGLSGELRTAAVIDPLCRVPGGPTVIHDVRIPLKGVRANIDHVVLAGRLVLLVDSKMWKPGTYWTLNGQTRRGWQRFPAADKQTMVMARQAVAGLARNCGADAHLVTPLLVLWPSSDRAPLHRIHLRVPGARAVAGGRLPAELAKLCRQSRGAQPDPALVGALLRLSNNVARAA